MTQSLKSSIATILPIIAAVCMITFANLAKADDFDMGHAAKTFAETQAQEVSKAAKSKSEQNFLKYLSSKTKEALAINYMAQWIAGPAWRVFNDEQKKAYLGAFSNYLINFYGSVLYQHKDSTFKFDNVKVLNPSEAVVTYLVPFDNQTVTIEWKIRRSLKENKLFITDFIVNGISFLQAKRTEYLSLFSANGEDPDRFIAAIKAEGNKKPKDLKIPQTPN